MTAAFGLRRFVAARFLSTLSDQFLLFAIPLAVFKATGSVTWSAVAFVVEWLPRIVFFPLGGFIADRWRPRRLFMAVEWGRALLLAALVALIAWRADATFVALTVASALLSIGYVLTFVATEAMLPRNLAPHELPRAHSLLQGVEQTSQVLGPALAAVVVATSDLNTLLLLACGLFAAAGLVMTLLRTADMKPAVGKGLAALLQSNRSAWQVLLQHKVLFLLSGLTWTVNLIYGAALVLSAPIIVKSFGMADGWFGVLQTTAAVVTIVIFTFVPRAIARHGLPAVGAVSFALMILAGLLLALAGNYAVYMAAYALLMAFDGVFSVYIRTVRGLVIPKEHLGKTTGLIGLMNMCSIPMAGVVVSVLSARHTPFEIFGVLFATAVVAAVVLIVIGRRAFGYGTWLPGSDAGVKPAPGVAPGIN
ncbi:MAG: MFS transporter [Rubrivivax sp.]|nr:MFS transporter [Rubrivivax sp.]